MMQLVDMIQISKYLVQIVKRKIEFVNALSLTQGVGFMAPRIGAAGAIKYSDEADLYVVASYSRDMAFLTLMKKRAAITLDDCSCSLNRGLVVTSLFEATWTDHRYQNEMSKAFILENDLIREEMCYQKPLPQQQLLKMHHDSYNKCREARVAPSHQGDDTSQSDLAESENPSCGSDVCIYNCGISMSIRAAVWYARIWMEPE